MTSFLDSDKQGFTDKEIETITKNMYDDEKEAFKILNDELKSLTKEEFEEYKKLSNADKINYLLARFGLKPNEDGSAAPLIDILDNEEIQNKNFFENNINWIIPFTIAFLIIFLMLLII